MSRGTDRAATAIAAIALLLALAPLPLRAAAENGETETVAPEDWSLHAQTTFIEQGNLRFHSPYRGPNSLDPAPRGRESWTGTLFLGARLPWDSGGALYFDPEFNQGFGLSKTEGVAGYINGEAQKGGFDNPKANVARLFVRQNFGLGGGAQAIAADQNQLADIEDANRITVTIGKYSPTDIFDTNDYADDPRVDFMNGAIWAAGAWDYPADFEGLHRRRHDRMGASRLDAPRRLVPRAQGSQFARSRAALLAQLRLRARAREPFRHRRPCRGAAELGLCQSCPDGQQ